ncbi:MAG: DUF4406 domain-containing protein [Muribaculaceae bacterium]|nr:DUF4406 domain-containing protein [Muribaculaceae bacterium]
MKKLIIYISLPITGDPKAREKADLIKAKLSRQGHIPVSPFDIYAGKNHIYEDYICADLRAMLDCDAIYFATGWGNSVGCGIEFDVANRINVRRKRLGIKPIKLIFGKYHNKIH